MAEFILLDTGSFQQFLSQKDRLIKEYETITDNYDAIVKSLEKNWKGYGADAFQRDAENVKANLTGIKDILVTMCDTLESCMEIFKECDTSLGKANQEKIK